MEKMRRHVRSKVLMLLLFFFLFRAMFGSSEVLVTILICIDNLDSTLCRFTCAT